MLCTSSDSHTHQDLDEMSKHLGALPAWGTCQCSLRTPLVRVGILTARVEGSLAGNGDPAGGPEQGPPGLTPASAALSTRGGSLVLQPPPPGHRPRPRSRAWVTCDQRSCRSYPPACRTVGTRWSKSFPRRQQVPYIQLDLEEASGEGGEEERAGTQESRAGAATSLSQAGGAGQGGDQADPGQSLSLRTSTGRDTACVAGTLGITNQP